ncbi:hypothetical protein TNCV_2303661 [Trichonephila clavipes]|nr:hypothetical protein TNCV_2303661 [Trichonephila clavipes]
MRKRKERYSEGCCKKKILKEIKIDPEVQSNLMQKTFQIIGRSVSAETVRNLIRQAGYKSQAVRKETVHQHSKSETVVGISKKSSIEDQ